MQEILHVYGAGALVRYLAPYSPDLNPIDGRYHQDKDFIRENDIAFRCVYLAYFRAHFKRKLRKHIRSSGYERRVD